MKFRLTTRNLLNYSNPYRPIFSHTLHIRHPDSFLISCSHLPRRKLRLINPQSTRQRSIYILHVLIPSRRTRHLLRLVPLQRDMKYRGNPPTNRYSNSIRRLCFTMRTNIILRGYCNYQPPIRYPLHWNNISRMNLRWLLRRQSHPYTFLCLPLYLTIYYYSLSISPSSIPTRDRL